MDLNFVNEIGRLRRHCQMFLFGCNPGAYFIKNDIEEDFVNFALMHLICTMFITRDKSKETRGGVFYRILNPIGYANLLDPIEEALNMKVGKTTLRNYIRNKRNKLAAHGDLSFDSQKDEVQEVTFNEEALDEFKEAMSTLEFEVSQLYRKLSYIDTDYYEGLNT